MPRDMFHSFSSCDDRMALLRHESAPRRLDELEDIDGFTSNMYVYVDDDGKDAKVSITRLIDPEFTYVKSDYAEEDPASKAYILNKPIIGETIVQEDFEATSTVGGVEAGDFFAAGTEWATIVRQILTGLGEAVELYWTITDKDPEDFGYQLRENGLPVTKFEHHMTTTRADLLKNGFTWPGRYKLNNQRQVVAINASARIDFDYMEQEGLLLSQNEGFVKMRHADFIYYYLERPSTGIFRAHYHAEDSRDEQRKKGVVYYNRMTRKPISAADLMIPFPVLTDSEGHEVPAYSSEGVYNYRNEEWACVDVDRLSLLMDGFTIEINSEGSILDSEGVVSPGPLYDNYLVLAVPDGLRIDCSSVDMLTNLDHDEGLVQEVPLGNWKFIYLDGKATGDNFKFKFNFREE